jgi:hypothetical protein
MTFSTESEKAGSDAGIKTATLQAIRRDADRVLLIISGALAEIGGRGPANSRATGNKPGIFAIGTGKTGDPAGNNNGLVKIAWAI